MYSPTWHGITSTGRNADRVNGIAVQATPSKGATSEDREAQATNSEHNRRSSTCVYFSCPCWASSTTNVINSCSGKQEGLGRCSNLESALGYCPPGGPSNTKNTKLDRIQHHRQGHLSTYLRILWDTCLY